jgi:hypothetical protein
MRQLTNGNPTSHVDTTMFESECILQPAHKNAVWCDGNGVKLLQYYPNWVSGDRYQNVIHAIELLSQHAPSAPGVGEARHRSFTEWQSSLPPDTPSGVYRLIVHHQVAHPPPESPSISSGLLGKSCGGSNAGITFRTSDAMENLSEHISLTFASIDPDSWTRYRQAYIKTSKLEQFTTLKVFNKCPNPEYTNALL